MLLLLLAATVALQPGDHMRDIDYLRLSYKSNKEAFAFGTFRFEYTIGNCASLPDAEAGVFARSLHEQGLYVFYGKNARYDLIADPREFAAFSTRIREHQFSSIAVALRMLTDGQVTLLDSLNPSESGSEWYHSAGIRRGRLFYKDGFFEFPLWLGDDSARGYDLFSDLSDVKEGRSTLIELDREALLDGLKVCKVSFSWGDGKRTYWIDSKRGSVPLRILDHFNRGDLDVIFRYDDVEHVEGAGWIPRKATHIIGSRGPVDRTVITEIDVRNRPTAAVFQLEFPEPINMVDRARQLVYPKSKTWSLLNLPGRSSAGVSPAIPTTFVAPADLPGEIEGGPPWATIALASAAVCLVVGSIAIVSRRGRKLHGA